MLTTVATMHIYSQVFAVLLLMGAFSGYSQENVTIDLGSVDNLSEEQNRKVAAAFSAMDAVQQADRYVESLSALLSGGGELALPVGIKKGDYELVIQKIYLNKAGNPSIYDSLPSFFKKTSAGGNGRITLSLQQVVLDENGFSGSASVENVIPSENINPESWGISLTGFSIGILKNGIAAFDLRGDVNIPPFGKRSLFPYVAAFNPAINEYEFKVGIAGQHDFPVLRSSISLNELSTVEILFKDAEIYPSIHASGTLSINAPLGKDSAKTFSVPDITFENMVIQRESPYFEVGAIGITGNLQSPQVAGFDLSISSIRTFRDNSKGSGLAFEAGISLSDMLGGSVGMQLYGDCERWKFREVAVSRIKVEYTSGAFGVSGDVWLQSSDPAYGNGFRGDIRLSLLDKFTFDAVGFFGKKDACRYFLADVFFEVSPVSGVTIPPMLTFYGFGGGLYRRMQQASKMPAAAGNASSEFGKSLSGISYVPDEKVGLGVMAATKFALTGSSSAFNAKVGFEMQFNNYGGLNFVQLRGDAAFVDAPEKWGSLAGNLSARVEKLKKSGASQPVKAKKSDLEAAPENKSSGFLTASMNIEYDVINRTFAADLNAYLNAGLIRGLGPNDRMGWSSAYFAPDAWYVYMGTPAWG